MSDRILRLEKSNDGKWRVILPHPWAGMPGHSKDEVDERWFDNEREARKHYNQWKELYESLDDYSKQREWVVVEMI